MQTLKLTGVQTYTSPLLHNAIVRLNNVITVTDDVAAHLLSLDRPSAEGDTTIPFFVAADYAPNVDYDFTGDVTSVKAQQPGTPLPGFETHHEGAQTMTLEDIAGMPADIAYDPHTSLSAQEPEPLKATVVAEVKVEEEEGNEGSGTPGEDSAIVGGEDGAAPDGSGTDIADDTTPTDTSTEAVATKAKAVPRQRKTATK